MTEQPFVMPKRRLGNRGPEVGAIGLGCMGMTWAYGNADEVESTKTLERALELGVTLFDTSDVYGPFTNEQLLGRVFQGKRDKIFLATKYGLIAEQIGNEWNANEKKFDYKRNAKPDYIKKACEASLSRLRTDHIDLYQLHRVDPEVPIEESVGAMAELVREGKVRYLGLSECTKEELLRAHRVHPITTLQSELSLWTRDVLSEILPACEQNGIGFLPFSPLGRGFLTGRYNASFDANDFRNSLPRFQQEAMAANMAIVEQVRKIGDQIGATPGQVALAWTLSRNPYVVPIPGTTKMRHLDENLTAAIVELSEADLAVLNALQPPVGTRY